MSDHGQTVNVGDDMIETETGLRETAVEMTAESEVPGKPTTLWLMLKQNKEYPPGYRHAWGEARVSTRKGGPANYPVEELKLSIIMPRPGGTEVADKTSRDAKKVKADAKYYGAVLGSFRSDWEAVATEPGYGTWRVRDHW